MGVFDARATDIALCESRWVPATAESARPVPQHRQLRHSYGLSPPPSAAA